MIRRVWVLVSLALVLAVAGQAQPVGASDEAVSVSGLTLARVIPAVASAPGAGGSFFKTAVQLFNPLGFPVTARIPSRIARSFFSPTLILRTGTSPASRTFSCITGMASMPIDWAVAGVLPGSVPSRR